jgi:NAD(P)-dependent dehydrogenase (short-subunit alcohol dehydrogenase family)
MNNLKDQVVIVTGRVASIGSALTSVLSQRGASVLAVDINEVEGKKIAKGNPYQIVFSKGNVSKKSVAEESVKLAVSKFGKKIGLVNNAHASRLKPLMDLMEDDWSLSFNTGFRATFIFYEGGLP